MEGEGTSIKPQKHTSKVQLWKEKVRALALRTYKHGAVMEGTTSKGTVTYVCPRDGKLRASLVSGQHSV